MSYFFYRQGQEYGPYSYTEVSGFLWEGRVRLSDLARTEAFREWTPLSTIWRTTSTGNSLTWPFYERNWMESIWMTLLWWLPLPIPVGMFLSAGWAIEAVRRKSRRAADLLPRPYNLGRLLMDGTIVVACFWLYIIIPLLLMWWSMSFGPWTVGLNTVVWLLHHLRGEATPSLWDMLYRQLLYFGARPLIAMAYLALASPLFTAAAILFAQTGRASSFFNLPASLVLVFHRFSGFAKLLAVQAAVVLVTILAALIAAASGIGAIAVILLVAGATWTITYYLGNLAHTCKGRIPPGS
jgi:hypothetical protein